MKTLFGVALLTAILLSGCNESSSEAKVVTDEASKAVAKAEEKVKPAIDAAKKKVTTHQTIVEVAAKKADIEAEEKLAKEAKKPEPEVSEFYKIFKDSAKIATEGKELLIMFGQDSDPYTRKIKDDIVSDTELSEKIARVVTPIYIDARGQKSHKFQHNGEMMDVDTKTLVSIYNVTSTPTLIFADIEASHIFVVPGYMPPEQFKVTLEFVEQGLWRGKDRKNGEVYTELKKFYKEHGIEIKADKK